ncbi:L,D-transpeptidase family protein [Streptomyces sp. NPDC006527]|uniref:L,D-transpeptidase family protein n=1 Tax=Streptomyces sp. NPDC006527 TaxID=3364749 RepID=UPI00368D1FC3
MAPSTSLRLTRLGISAATVALSVTLTGCTGSSAVSEHDARSSTTGMASETAAPAPGASSTTQAERAQTSTQTAASSAPVPAQLPGLGPRTLAQIPKNTRQVVLVTGQGKNSSTSHVVLYQRTDEGWGDRSRWPAHNARNGWTDDHRLGDLRSPIGVFTLTDAGGLLPDPGSKLPYDQSRAFTISGTGFEGEPLAGSFDYVVAINYNRKPGTTPLDWTRPLGEAKGGGIWLHVDHGGPTHGCVSLTKEHVKELLRTLDPDRHPVIVMGDAKSLER